MTTSNYVNLIDSQFISISGDDRKDFLQGLITNDINKCNSNTPIYSCFLSPQGKFIADFFVADREKNYLIEIHKKFMSGFLDKLKIYKLRSKIIINDNEDFESLVILENNNLLQSNNDIINFIDPRNNKLGRKVYIKLDRINDFKNMDILNLVVNFVDILGHSRSESKVLSELIPNESAYRQAIFNWFSNSWLLEALNTFKSSLKVFKSL